MQKRNNLVLGLLFLLAFFLGMVFAPKPEPIKIVQRDEQREVQWLNLKKLDEKAFSYASTGFSLCSEMLEAASDYDYATLAVTTAQMNQVGEDMLELNSERQSILQKLGF